MKSNLKEEARQLPLMLGKLIGGILAVVGFGGLVYISTRPPEPTALLVASYAVAGLIGIAVFVVCARIMSSRFGEDARDESGKKDRPGLKVLPWIILLVLAALFIIKVLLS